LLLYIHCFPSGHDEIFGLSLAKRDGCLCD
jgi:hypothetical protein